MDGGRDMSVAVDAEKWQDIPLYVRAGSIVATQPQSQGNDLSPKTSLVLDVFPSAARAAGFLVYDDDGHTYAYEKGEYFRQEVSAKQSGSSVEVPCRPPLARIGPTFRLTCCACTVWAEW